MKHTARSAFRRIKISGTARQRGLAHGEQMRHEITDALVYYKAIFRLSDDVILERAAYFKAVITAFSSEYAEEITAIANGAGQDPLWIFALNARTEILAINGGLFSNECTSMCFCETSILGQTWDWGKPLEDLCALMRIERPDGHVIEMLTEPGIIGKIGMNNAGLGVCLNILSINAPLEGLPIHIVLRAILDCRTTHEAAAIIHTAGLGKSSNIIVADAAGDSFDTEFAGDETLSPAKFGDNLVHTNHYLSKPINDLNHPQFFNSQARLNTAITLLDDTDQQTPRAMQQILSDRSHPQYPVYRPYALDDKQQEIGTVATIVMDLPKRQLHIRKGNDENKHFVSIEVA